MAKSKKTFNVKLSTDIEPIDILVSHCGVDYNSNKKTVNCPIVSYGLFYIFSGSGGYKVNGKTFPVKPGDVCFIPSGIEYTTIPDEGQIFQHYHLNFYGRNAQYYIEKTEFSVDNPVVKNVPVSIKNKMENIYKLLGENTFSDTLKANMVFFEILHYFIQKAEQNIPVKILQKNDFVQRVITYIRKNYMYDIKINKIAEDMHINRSYLSHLFSYTKGISIKDYLTEYRMTVAKKLLASTNKPISEISNLSGFPDTVSFYRQFKKSTAISPQQYKTKLKNDPRFRTVRKF